MKYDYNVDILKFGKDLTLKSVKQKQYRNKSVMMQLLRSRFSRAEQNDILQQLDEFGKCEIVKDCYEYRIIKNK